jgi:hypothetical protein
MTKLRIIRKVSEKKDSVPGEEPEVFCMRREIGAPQNGSM